MLAWAKPWGWRRVFSSLLMVLPLFSGCNHKPEVTRMSFREIMAADVQPSKRGQRVVATGVVTYIDPEWHLLFVQDKDKAVYLEPPLGSDLKPGDQVEVKGTTTDPGKFLEKTEFVVTTNGAFPRPVRVANAKEFVEHPSEFIEATAVVRWSGIRNGRATLEASSGDAHFEATVFPGSSEDLPRIGSEIHIVGVQAATYDSQGQVQALRLWTPSARAFQILRPGPQDPFAVALAQPSTLQQTPVGALVHLSGRIMDRANSLSLLDGGKAVTVNLRRPLHGDFASAEVVGFWSGSSIDDAMIRPTGELLARRGDIRTISELKHLTVAEATSARRVSVRGVVTYLDPYWGLLFIQDSTAAAFINPRGLNLRLRPGDLVDVSGVTAPGDYAPIIADEVLSYVGRASFPAPLKLDLVQGNLAEADSRWCSFSGVVHSVDVVDGHTNLRLGAGETALNVQLPTLIHGERLLDKEVSVTGALGILFNERRQAVGHQIFVPAPEFLNLVATGGTPNLESTIAVLRRYAPDFDERHSVAFRGTVVLKSDRNTIFVQDHTAGIEVRAVSPLAVSTGDRVSVRGFLHPGEYSPALEDATVMRLSGGAVPDPERVSAESAAEGPHDSEYVAMTGTLVARNFVSNGLTLVLNDGGIYFYADGPASQELQTARIGSVLEVRGVAKVTLDRSHVPYSISGFRLAFDSPHSVRLLKPGSWLDVQRVRWALLLIGLLGLATALWAILLRRQVRLQTQELQSSLAAKRRARQFDVARNDILESIARNAPLPESMERLALAVQEQIPTATCVIVLPADGKSFTNGKLSPMLIAPSLPEKVQQLHVLATVLEKSVSADERNIIAADGDLMNDLLRALQQAGAPYTAGHNTLVFSASGAVVGILFLFSTSEIAVPKRTAQRQVLVSASRLISLAVEHCHMHDRLLHEAHHDGLTGLPNRAVAEDRLEQAIARAERRNKSFAVFCIDLDGFKAVNDQLGHDAGDELLRAVALRLRSRIRHSDTVARMGGDEFLAIIEECSGESSAKAVADSLIAALINPAMTEAGNLMISASIGIALYPGDGRNASQLRRNADQAMYRAKNNGGGRSCLWASDPESPGKAIPAKGLR